MSGAERRMSGWTAAIVVYALVAFVALAGVLLAPGTIGHHWDWLIPSDPGELRRFAWTSGFAWQDFAFGSYVTYRYATTLTSFLFGAPGFIGLGGAFVTKSLLFGSLFFSGLGMRFLALSLTSAETRERDGYYATFAGMLYAVAPYAYNQIVAGDQSALISAAASPVAIGLAVRATLARDRTWLAYALTASLLLAVIVATAQMFVFTVALLWLVCLVLARNATTVRRLAVLTACGTALCSFWIVPAFLAGGAVHTVVQTASVDRAFATLQQFSNPLMTLTTIGFPGDFYLHALGAGAPGFFIAFSLLVAACAAALIKGRRPLAIAFAAAFVLFSLLPLGGNPVIGPPLLAVFTAFLPYSLFLRTPQHIMFVVSLTFPVLVYLCTRDLPARWFGAAAAAGALVFAAYGQGFFLHSNFFGLVGPFRETEGEREMVAEATQPGDDQFRTLFIPNAASFYYHPGIFDYYFEGADEAQIRFLPSTTLAAGSKWSPYDGAQAMLKALDELVPDGADPTTQRMLLKLAGVKRIIVHDIGVPGAGNRIGGAGGRAAYEAALAHSGVAGFSADYGDRSVWTVPGPVSRAYAPDCIFGVPSRADPYDVLALAYAAQPCTRPATVTASPANRSESILSAATFRSGRDDGIALAPPRANVAVESSDDRKGYFATIPAGVQDVEAFALPPVPAGATGIALRIYASAPRRIWMQLYAPDFRNYYQANVDFSGRVQDVAVNFSNFDRLGRPRGDRIRTLRFASLNTQLRDVQMYFGGFRWLFARKRSSVPDYLAVASNRWDQYYFGGEHDRVLFEAAPGLAPAYASAGVARDGVYDVFARVQELHRAFSLQLGLDGSRGACKTSKMLGDVSDRLVRLARVPLHAGLHVLSLRYCKVPVQPKTQDVGVVSLIVAAAKLQPPVTLADGVAEIRARSAGGMRVTATGPLLVLSDAFDARWSGSQDGATLAHVVANGYANGWTVDHVKGGDVYLSFWPQRFLDAGLVLTAIFGCATVAAIAVVLAGSRRQRALDLRRAAQE